MQYEVILLIHLQIDGEQKFDNLVSLITGDLPTKWPIDQVGLHTKVSTVVKLAGIDNTMLVSCVHSRNICQHVDDGPPAISQRSDDKLTFWVPNSWRVLDPHADVTLIINKRVFAFDNIKTIFACAGIWLGD